MLDLRRAVDDLCASVARSAAPGPAADGVAAVRARLAAPLQVAVAGRTSSGKSTLVNALVGRRVAPTAAGECTRLVTRFTHAEVERVEVVLRDGTTRALPFEADGSVTEAVSARLGVAPAAVSHLEVRLSAALLTGLTVVDTPGLAGADDELVGRTTAVLDGGLDDVSRRALTGAEAVLYVLTQGVRADDADVLATFTAATAGRDSGPVNALAVLNKADTVVPDGGAGAASPERTWAAAQRLAARQARALGPRVADVLPVVGLLAQSVTTGAFGDPDAAVLRSLAAVDPAVLQAMLASADLFTTLPCGVDQAARSALLHRLGLHGVRVGLDVLAADPGVGTGALRARLHAATGLSALRARLDSVLGARSEVIKAAAALASLTALAADDPVLAAVVTDGVEALLARPEAHRLRLVQVLTQLASGAVALPEDLAAEVVRVGADTAPAVRLAAPGATPAQLSARALERAGWWRSWAGLGASPAQARLAHEVHRAYFLLWQQLGGGGS
ncbi:dynamin family protein [Rhodococcus aerolatus]